MQPRFETGCNSQMRSPLRPSEHCRKQCKDRRLNVTQTMRERWEFGKSKVPEDLVKVLHHSPRIGEGAVVRVPITVLVNVACRRDVGPGWERKVASLVPS